MSILFFEGFNYSNSDTIKLNPNNWTTNNSSNISFVGGRTDTAVSITHRPISSGLEYNTTLTLSNFIDPLISNSGFGLGFGGPAYDIITNNTSAPANENLISFHDDTNELLRIDVIKTTYESTNSLGFAIYQSGLLIDTYDLKSVAGYSWGFDASYGIMKLANGYYFEIYIDAKNENKLAIRFSANNTIEAFLKNTSGNMYTNITGFTNLKSIKFYSRNDIFGAFGTRYFDDLYITGGNTYSECLLGNNTKIYRLNADNDSSYVQWQGRSNGTTYNGNYSYINNNNGDTNYIFSSTSGNQAIFSFNNLSVNAASGIGGIQIINIARNQSVDNSGFINVMTDSDETPIVYIGSGYTISSDQYNSYSQFIFTNPITSGAWTTSDINNMQIGVKHLGSN